MIPFPSEIWTHVFSFACNDGGRTGGVLSLVSRSFCCDVQPVKLQSIAVRGRTRIEQIYKILKDTSAVVHHLFICTEPSPSHPVVENPPSVFPTVIEILKLVALTLRSLHIITLHERPTLFLPILFPELSELVLRGPFLLQNNSESPLGWDDPPFSCPKLRRLALAQIHWDNVPDLFRQINIYAPNVTSICLYAGSHSEMSLLNIVDNAVRVSKRTKDDYKEGISSTLEHLTIRLISPAQDTTLLLSRFFRTLLVPQHQDHQDPRVAILEDDLWPDEWVEKSYRDWMSLQDGDGINFWCGPRKET